MKARIVIILCQLSLLFSELCSQEIRAIEFSVYSQYSLKDVYYFPVDQAAINAGEDASAPVKVESHSLKRTGPYVFKGGETIYFYEADLDEPLGQVRLPKASAKLLLVFVRNEAYRKGNQFSTKYLIYPFNDELSNLPSNTVKFLNLSRTKLYGEIDGKRVQLAAGESDPLATKESLSINLWLRDSKREKAFPAVIKKFQFQLDHRYLVILFPPVLTGSSDLDLRILAESTALSSSSTTQDVDSNSLNLDHR